MTRIASVLHRSKRRLLGFAAVSFGLHLALLWPWSPVLPRMAGHTETVLSVDLNTMHDQIPVAKSIARAQRPPNRNPGTIASAATRTRVVAETPSAAPAPAHAVDNPQVVDAVERAIDGTRARVQAQLLADLQRHFEYPLLARQRGWQGTVWLSFVVAPDGALDRIQVARGSGYQALDHSAVTALRRVGQLTEARAWLDGRALEMQLPVVYRLMQH